MNARLGQAAQALAMLGVSLGAGWVGWVVSFSFQTDVLHMEHVPGDI